MITPEQSALLRRQAEIEMRAHSLGLALSLWAKTEEWQGSHKWLGRFSKECRKHVKGVCKFIADYAAMPVSVPGVADCPCTATSLEDCYQQIMSAVQEAQEGWQSVSASAGPTKALEEFCDRYLDENIVLIKTLNRHLKRLSQIGGDQAALLIWDRDRE